MILILSGPYSSGKTVLAKTIIKAAGKIPLYLPNTVPVDLNLLPEDPDGYYLLDNTDLTLHWLNWLRAQVVDIIVTTTVDTNTVQAGLPVWRLAQLPSYVPEKDLLREEVRPLR